MRSLSLLLAEARKTDFFGFILSTVFRGTIAANIEHVTEIAACLLNEGKPKHKSDEGHGDDSQECVQG